MKPATRKYKTKNRKTRRGGSNIQVKAPMTEGQKTNIAVTNPPPPMTEAKPIIEAKTEAKPVSWFSSISIFGASKPGDKIVKAVDELIKLIKEKNISTDLKLEQIKSEAAKLI